MNARRLTRVGDSIVTCYCTATTAKECQRHPPQFSAGDDPETNRGDPCVCVCHNGDTDAEPNPAVVRTMGQPLKPCPLCKRGAYVRRDRMVACSFADCPLGDERVRLTRAAWDALTALVAKS